MLTEQLGHYVVLRRMKELCHGGIVLVGKGGIDKLAEQYCFSFPFLLCLTSCNYTRTYLSAQQVNQDIRFPAGRTGQEH